MTTIDEDGIAGFSRHSVDNMMTEFVDGVLELVWDHSEHFIDNTIRRKSCLHQVISSVSIDAQI